MSRPEEAVVVGVVKWRPARGATNNGGSLNVDALLVSKTHKMPLHNTNNDEYQYHQGRISK